MIVKANRVGRPRLGSTSLEAEAVILEAALELFAAKNFSAVTIKDISKATGFNTALIYYYFESKEDLFGRAVAMAVDKAFVCFRSTRKDTNQPRKIIRSWVETHVVAFDTIAKLIKISIDYASTGDRKKAIDQAIQKFYDDERKVLHTALRTGVETGEFGAIDIDQTATFISTYLDGVFVRTMMLQEFDALRAIQDLQTFLKVRLARPTS